MKTKLRIVVKNTLHFQEGLNYNNYTGLFSGERIHVCKRRVL